MAAGLEPELPPGGLPDRWRGLHQRLREQLLVFSRDPREAVRRACEGIERQAAVTRAIIRAMPSEAEYLSLSRLAAQLRPIDWLWPGWIPRGMLTVLGASPGAGKSLVGLDLARRIIHGMGFPDGSTVPRDGAACI